MVPFAISMPAGAEWLVILVIVVMLFGVGRLPQVFKSLGEGMKAFRDAQRDDASATDVGGDKRRIGDNVHEAEEVREKVR